jgi:nucleoside-diphosphate-sugar epimerase
MGPLFLTGATGFVGRRVLERLPAGLIPDIRCLVRDPGRLPPAQAGGPAWHPIRGDLDALGEWARHLQGCECVLHLAAITGKARPEDFDRVNFQGTRLLVEQAQAAGVKRFIFVSSIAAGFSDQRHYPYAASKRAAEAAVLSGGMDALVVRPTMVLGPGSAVLKGLQRLATAPVGLVFGRGSIPVQPIHRDDLANLLIGAVSLAPLGAQIVEAGGPTTLAFVQLLREVRRSLTGREGPMLHLPLGPARALLGVLEQVLFNALPITAGQLASFANPGTARANPLIDQLHSPRLGLSEMLASSPPHA